MRTRDILMGCAQRKASFFISGSNWAAGPKIPPPKIIMEGLNTETRLATDFPHALTASRITFFATGWPCSNAENSAWASLKGLLPAGTSWLASLTIPDPDA